MTPPAPNTPLSEDSRLLLADAASSIERANQPRYVIVLAMGLLAITGVVALLSWSQLAAARDQLTTEQALTDQTLRVVDELTAARADETERGTTLFAPDPFIVGRLETFAREAGLTSLTVAEADDSRTPPDLFKRRKYTATLQPQEAEAIFKWVNHALADVQGLELSVLELQPGIATVDGKPRWMGSVSFTRWERRS